MKSILFIAAATGALAAACPLTAAVQVGPVAEVRVSFGDEVERKPRIYGQREKDRLVKELTHEVEKAVGGFKSGGGVLEVTIEEVKANRPTWTQMTYEPSISYAYSFGNGGATLDAVYVAPSGERTPIRYSWYETDIRNAQYVGDWHDAERTFARFAKRVAQGG